MLQQMFIDTDNNDAIVFGRQTTSNDNGMTKFNWKTFLKKGLYLDLDSTADAELIEVLEELGWDSEVIE